jgi:hypothetical protein
MIAKILAAAACCLLAVIAASISSAQSEGEVLFGLIALPAMDPTRAAVGPSLES